jgi:hypothetical protein
MPALPSTKTSSRQQKVHDFSQHLGCAMKWLVNGRLVRFSTSAEHYVSMTTPALNRNQYDCLASKVEQKNTWDNDPFSFRVAKLAISNHRTS